MVLGTYRSQIECLVSHGSPTVNIEVRNGAVARDLGIVFWLSYLVERYIETSEQDASILAQLRGMGVVKFTIEFYIKHA